MRRNQWLASVGITGWNGSESPAGLRRNTHNVSELAENCVHAGFEMLDLTPRHVERLSRLVFHEQHRDPFDHLLLAQTAVEDATFVTDDRHAGLYGVPIMKAR